MKKTLSYLACASMTLTLFALACGDSKPPKVPHPTEDGGVLWKECNPSLASSCGTGEECRVVPHYDRAVCVRPCDAQTACGTSEAACCPIGGAGSASYCLPTEACTSGGQDDGGTSDGGGETTDAGDSGTGDSGTTTDAGTDTDAGTTTDAGTDTDAGTTTDAGTDTDAGTTTDAGTDTDAGTTTDAGTDTDAGSTTDAGTDTDAGSSTDAGTDTDAGSSTDAGTDTDAGSGGGTTNIRIMAANLTSGNGQDYDPGHGIRLMQGVDPDVVLIQEFNYKSNSVADIREMVQTTFGANFSYYRETGAQIPNGIISRWPIIASGEWTDVEVGNRDFAWARIDIPGPKDLWAVSVHLLTRSSGVRNTEARNLVNYIRANVPEDDYLVIGGDFNTDSFGESCFGTFSEVIVTSAPYPADRNGKTGTNFARAKPYDHVMVDADLNQYRTATVIGSSQFPNGLVLDSRVYSPLSEIAPVQAGDSAASNMQHMGVVKDFVVPY
ncbi:endonuclease/exonuclease/phosphatase family protein [Myxococcus landrumensis]|uniref:Endonuclease/exonuclease/phosphatase family protein n=1 Tax=Myxococcus landrumensis TaxID=2813577 RepID=A0ABX7MYT0_9BACT|nr:endonuclease/exonuclease/phosphatase family protein [Myxococcus landrumus]QSQ11592.1 endonuclease/exonuclease/phosphatase family protein [Myxococcus landrumus]